MSDVPEQDQTAATPATVEPTAEPISPESWEAAVGVWVSDHVRNSPIAGATEAWNHLMGVLPRLRAALNAELGKKE